MNRPDCKAAQRKEKIREIATYVCEGVTITLFFILSLAFSFL